MAREKDYEKLLNNWPYEYYHLTNAMERRKLLQVAEEHGLTPEENQIRSMLWELRHPNGEKLYAQGEVVVDKFMAAWMYFDYASEHTNSWFGKKKIIKNVKKSLADMGSEVIKPYGELGELLLYDELYQLVYHYIQLCESDRNYGSLILGIGKISKESYAIKVAKNLYATCYKIAIDLNMQEDFAILQKAATEAYYDKFPDYQTDYDRIIAEGTGNL